MNELISVSICFPVSEEGDSMMSSAIRLAIAGSRWGFCPPALALLTGILLFMVLDECASASSKLQPWLR
ncbi:hypothetical protein MTR67_015272 [Solanum verrucosum]|uniref:Uncharacterized protein n=1 Tax=Solanum verrucosum TaxID=315347 RepID=A0AAF0QFG3_SOLVR|nr:hypothetical protein MTR67_015272 [Solanum verrucosum]